MQYTTHFNLNLPEGTDIVNPLVQDNPNYTAIDAAMFANKQAVIGTASEVVSGTVHAITRSNPDSDYFRFTATGNWNTGDSMSVDGTNVSVYLSNGSSPANNAYIINTEVLALLSGTRVTLITSSGSINAAAVSYDNSGSGLSATNAQDAIDEIEADLNRGSVSITADGIKTFSELLNDLYLLINPAKISHRSVLRRDNMYYCLHKITGGVYSFVFTNVTPTYYDINELDVYSTGSGMYYARTTSGSTSISDYSSSIASAGSVIEIIY